MDMQSDALELEYLQATLSWLDACLEGHLQRWLAAGQDPADRFRGLRLTEQDAAGLLRVGPGGHWGTGVELPEETTRRIDAALAQAQERRLALEKQAAESGIELRLKALGDRFGLGEFEWLAFILCLAPAIDLRYERIYGFLQDDITRVRPSADLILQALLPEGLERLKMLACFNPEAPLRLFRLIEPAGEGENAAVMLRQTFTVPRGVVAWLLGTYSADDSLGPGAQLIGWDQVGENNLDENNLGENNLAMDDFSGRLPAPEVFSTVSPFVSLYGADLFQQEVAVRALAGALQRPLLVLALAEQPGGEPGTGVQAGLDRISAAVRDARLLNALLYVQACDRFIDRNGTLLPDAYQALRLAGEGVCLSSREAFRFGDSMPGNDYPLMRVELERLDADDRGGLWRAMLDEAASGLSDEEIDGLAGQFVLTSGQIMAAASAAMSQAIQEQRSLTSADLFAAARFHSGHHLADLAQKIEPRYSWEDLVLPETPVSMLHELVNTVRSRPLVLDRWGLGRKLTASKGISALFTGQPGTGKTLAAQIIAHELGLDLYRIDLSTVVSKYIGETEKNLERIFAEARTSNAILFFDEADAIFGKRSEVKDAHDRYANIEVGYLLQRMEAYDGVAILATNLRANLDEAFTRRLHFIVHFPFPEEEYRLRIWNVLMPPGLPKADDLDLALMSRRFKFAGGNIRNIIAAAAFLAANDGGRVTMKHMMHAARRETQKMGKLLQEKDYSL